MIDIKWAERIGGEPARDLKVGSCDDNGEKGGLSESKPIRGKAIEVYFFFKGKLCLTNLPEFFERKEVDSRGKQTYIV